MSVFGCFLRPNFEYTEELIKPRKSSFIGITDVRLLGEDQVGNLRREETLWVPFQREQRLLYCTWMFTKTTLEQLKVLINTRKSSFKLRITRGRLSLTLYSMLVAALIQFLTTCIISSVRIVFSRMLTFYLSGRPYQLIQKQ